MTDIKGFLSKHADFGIDVAAVWAIMTALAVIPVIVFADPHSTIAYENGVLENIQLSVLTAGCWLGLGSKTDKKFFRFIAMALFILILREVSCGRTLFFPVPGQENSFYKWNEIRYGYLAHPLYAAYIAGVLLYFLKNRLFATLRKYLCETKIPVWNALLMFAAVLSSVYAEDKGNYVFEESAELVFYVSLVGIIHAYTRKSRFSDDHSI